VEGKKMETVQMANTVNGFAIAITKVPNRVKSGQTVFSVVRVDRTNKFATLTNHNNEAAARKVANKYWLQDMGR
jgi:hypothetical protein